MKQYHDLVSHVLDNGHMVQTRNGNRLTVYGWQDIDIEPTNSTIEALFPDGSTDIVYTERWDNKLCYYHACNDEYCDPQPVGWRNVKMEQA